MTLLSSFLDDGQHADRIEVGWVRRGSPEYGDPSRTKNNSRTESEAIRKDLSLWNCSLSSKTRKEYPGKDPKGIPLRVLKC